ncbi:MlaC/ttg2D family ABC transporter substrate-binding protein [Sneathiella litorea]|uniref:ABC transporter substrate-binding protein n=1 Tax=Sneathiella litorea TaxID=2606216 RepID=A0A6L8WBP1_9PROT|nr:ABC transporter substrate-binding protein [Sneathiella litorea]MZR31892.1 ABC transporter substrate-binding protein [Sneathiella litorea]
MFTRRRVFLGMLVAVSAMTGLFQSPAFAEDSKEQAALSMVKKIGDEAIATLSNESLSDSQKQDQFEKFLDSSFDMQRIGRFVLGQYWRSATEAEQNEFLVVFRDYMVASYAEKIGSYTGENLDIKDATSLNDKESLVHSVIVRPNGPPIKLDWRVRRTNDGEKIVDVIIEGISMAQTHRSEFSSVISQPGVGIEGLINKLKEQIKTASNK